MGEFFTLLLLPLVVFSPCFRGFSGLLENWFVVLVFLRLLLEIFSEVGYSGKQTKFSEVVS